MRGFLPPTEGGVIEAADATHELMHDFALRKQNLEVPAGRIESREREFSVVAQTDLKNPAEFAAVVVKNVNGFPVRIADIGRVEIAAQNERSVVRFNVSTTATGRSRRDGG